MSSEGSSNKWFGEAWEVVFVGVIVLLWAYSCSTSAEPDPSQRTGAVCQDGSDSYATGNGACSGHGGVEFWTYD